MTEACAELGLRFRLWQPEMRRAGLRGALYLIRPDGYIALADSRVIPTCCAEYFEEHRLSIGRA